MSVDALSRMAEKRNATIHGSCVAVGGNGLLIVGSSGSGKSSLALTLVGYGAELVADDQVELRMENDRVLAQSPAAISGLIEARGLGLIRCPPTGSVPLAYVVDLDQIEEDRFPEHRTVRVLRQSVPLLRAVKAPHFAPSLMQLLKIGRVDPEWPSK